MHSNLLMYLTAMSAVSIHNLVNNINEMTQSYDSIRLETSDTNWTLTEDLNNIFPRCNGTRQSPINIEPLKTTENLNLRLGLTAYDKPISGLLLNQFPTFRLSPISFKWPRPSALVSTSIARSFNPFADSHFTLNYIQFHWSKIEERNLSIHQIDNDNFPVEIHFVHFNTAYPTIEEAFTKPNGLLILAAMVVPSTHESYVFDKLLDNLLNITQPGKQVLIEEDSTWRSLLPFDTSRFYRYQGSMITPPCYESVQWIVFDDKLRLGQRQLKRLRRHSFISKDLRTEKEIDWADQRRQSQKLHDRVIERSFNLRAAKGYSDSRPARDN